jgi:hypothetical protein
VVDGKQPGPGDHSLADVLAKFLSFAVLNHVTISTALPLPQC